MTKEVLYFKTGLGRGGASLADMDMIDVVKKIQGINPTVYTGFIIPEIKKRLKDGDVRLVFDSRLCRENVAGLDAKQVRAIIEKESDRFGILLFSQISSGDAKLICQVVSDISMDRSVISRSHDPIRDEGFDKLSQGSIGMPITEIIARQMETRNSKIDIVIVPPCIDFNRLKSQNHPETVRETIGVKADDYILFQPTRVDINKRIGKAVTLAHEIQKNTRNKEVFLLVAGGTEGSERARKEKKELLNYSRKIGFNGLIFLEEHNKHRYSRVADYMQPGVANLVTFMSEIEAFGLVPLDSCVTGIPCVTSNYVSADGEELFKTVYPGFNFIIDDSNNYTVGRETVETVLDLFNNPSRYNSQLANNRVKAEKYNEKVLIEALKIVFDRY